MAVGDVADHHHHDGDTSPLEDRSAAATRRSEDETVGHSRTARRIKTCCKYGLVVVIVGPIYVALLSFFAMLFGFLVYAFATYGILHYPLLMGLGMVGLCAVSGATMACLIMLTPYVFNPDWWRELFS